MSETCLSTICLNLVQYEYIQHQKDNVMYTFLKFYDICYFPIKNDPDSRFYYHTGMDLHGYVDDMGVSRVDARGTAIPPLLFLKNNK